MKIALYHTADLSAPVGTGARIAEAVSLGYTTVNSIVLQLQARECLLMLLLVGVAQDMM